MSKSKNSGACQLCQQPIEHRIITKHLSQCVEKYLTDSVSQNLSEREKIFLIKIFAGKFFWLYIEIFCDPCQKNHDCDEDMFLPVVNSPRMGVCGYTGAE